jgi:F-type H+-transporting ATPase subunit b
MLELKGGLVFWTILTFLITLLVLRRAAWKPILKALLSREERIRTALHEAEEAQQEARQLMEENRRQLALAEQNAQRLIKEGREMGERLKGEIVEKANSSAQHMIRQAKEEIGREKEAALNQLRSEVAELAIMAAGKILDANLDSPAQRKLVDKAIAELAESGRR